MQRLDDSRTRLFRDGLLVVQSAQERLNRQTYAHHCTSKYVVEGVSVVGSKGVSVVFQGGVTEWQLQVLLISYNRVWERVREWDFK